MQSNSQFKMIFWFVVFLTAFGMAFTIYLLVVFKGDAAERFADQMLMFWLSTAVGGGVGYLIGSSAPKNNAGATPPGTTTADISATITTDSAEVKTDKDK